MGSKQLAVKMSSAFRRRCISHIHDASGGLVVNITVSHPGLLRYLAMAAGFAAPQPATPGQMQSPSKASTGIQPQAGSDPPAGTTFGAALWSNLPVPLPVQSLKVCAA